jgi:hypothetical protein
LLTNALSRGLSLSCGQRKQLETHWDNGLSKGTSLQYITVSHYISSAARREHRCRYSLGFPRKYQVRYPLSIDEKVSTLTKACQ